jgi:hypothetical protein
MGWTEIEYEICPGRVSGDNNLWRGEKEEEKPIFRL